MDKKWWTLLAVCVGTFMLLIDVTIVVVALPEIQTSLHAGLADIQWVVDAYALTLASLMLTAGVLADRYGRRLLFTSGLAIFTVGSALCGLAQSPTMLILSRSGQGIGGAIMFATSLALLAQTFHGKDRAAAFGAWGAIAGAAVALGPILGGLITSWISWRGIFLVNVPLGLAAIAITMWRVEESRAERPGALDLPGFALLTAGLVSLVYGLIRASGTSWGDSGVLACLVLGGALLAAFLLAEQRSSHPLFDLSLFRIPTFVGGSVAAFTMNCSLFALFLYLVIYLQDLLGYSALGAGLRLLVITVGLLLAAGISGRLSQRIPLRWLVGGGLALVGIGLLLLSGLRADSSWIHLVPGFVVAGIGAGLVNPPLGMTAVSVVRPERAGMASGVNSTFRQIGIATGIAALGSILAASLQGNSGSRRRIDAFLGRPRSSDRRADTPRQCGPSHRGCAPRGTRSSGHGCPCRLCKRYERAVHCYRRCRTGRGRCLDLADPKQGPLSSRANPSRGCQ
jgi:EmrB/QacA subfamily drug resistance transporter